MSTFGGRGPAGPGLILLAGNTLAVNPNLSLETLEVGRELKVPKPTKPEQAANKQYVDRSIAEAIGTKDTKGVVQRVAPASGDTVQASTKRILLIDPVATLDVLNIDFPADPEDGDGIVFTTTQDIYTLNVNNATWLGAIPIPSSLTAGSGVHFYYSEEGNGWFYL